MKMGVKLLSIVTFFGVLLSTCIYGAKSTNTPSYKDVLRYLTQNEKDMTAAYEKKVKETVESYVVSRFEARIAKRKQEKNKQPYIVKKLYKNINLQAYYQSAQENSHFKNNPASWGYCDLNTQNIYVLKREAYKKYDAITVLFVVEHELTHLEHYLNRRAQSNHYFLINKHDNLTTENITLLHEEHDADTEGINNHPNPYLYAHALQWVIDHSQEEDICKESCSEYLPLPLKYETAYKNYQKFYISKPELRTQHAQEATEYMPPTKTKKMWSIFKQLDSKTVVPSIVALFLLFALLLKALTGSRRIATGPLACALAFLTLYNVATHIVCSQNQRDQKIALCKSLHKQFIESQNKIITMQ